jgi:alkylation response protein AidB-like acyl-CoA dehydrogenase
LDFELGVTVDQELSEEQKLLKESVREFAESEVRPLAKELDETGRFPRELFKKAATLQIKAVKHSDTYAINGTKAWITNGGVEAG